MKKLGEEPMSQAERTKKYYSSHDLVLFSARIEKDLVDKLKIKLESQRISVRQFITDSIRRYLDE